MKLTRQYIKPGNSPALIGLGKLLLPTYMRLAKQVSDMVVVENGLKQFASLTGKRVVICPNHASEDDAEAIFGFSRLTREDFYYLTAHEIFHGHKGWNRFILPGVGCYSVTRGTPDAQAYKTTRQLLIENNRKLVVFPEGEISHFNEVVMPLEPGVVRISFSALHKLKALGIDDDIIILPVAILYNYTSNIQSRLERAVAEIEGFLSVSLPRTMPLKARVHSSVVAFISSLELKYEIDTSLHSDFSLRAFNLREKDNPECSIKTQSQETRTNLST
jgi:1-acyl-sn-glycerol-3-phosphate acyltransferase